MFRRVLVERSHGEVVILALSDSELLFKISKVKELMTGVEWLCEAFSVNRLSMIGFKG